jgi:hypothetical protein
MRRKKAHLWLDIVSNPATDKEGDVVLLFSLEDVVGGRKELGIADCDGQTRLLLDLSHCTLFWRLSDLEMATGKLQSTCGSNCLS